jgi:hypothetical protein
MKKLFVAAFFLFSGPAFAQDDEVQKVAETYLNALTGKGDEGGKDLLLGGVTMNAQLFTLENWALKGKEVKKEEADVGHAVAMMNDLDKAGRKALTKMMGAEAVGDDLKMTEVSKEEAEKLLGPTRDKAKAFNKAHPVLAHFGLRVDKEVYWHPKNPMRPLLAKAGGSGKYTFELHRFNVLSVEGPAKTPREWPLRVVRFKCGKIDTGWKILPASDWNAE